MRLYFISLLCFTFLGQSVYTQNKREEITQNEMSWWYEKPATKYWEGLPIGTGRFAAMVQGKIQHEIIPFNEETLWSGGPYNPNNPDGPKILARTQQYILDKDYVKADEEAEKLGSTPVSVQHYQPMGILHITNEHDTTDVENYMRKLSMDSAMVTVTYRLDGVDYKREVFASYPDQVLVMKISASEPGSINLATWLSSLQPSAVTQMKEGDIVMSGRTEDVHKAYDGADYGDQVIPGEINWQSRLKVKADGGKITFTKEQGLTGDQIQVQDANSVTFLLSGATNWKSWNDVSADEKERSNDYMENASKFRFAKLKERHIRDYAPLFAACKIDLGKNKAMIGLNTTERINRLRSGDDDPLYVSRYFQYGRYLLLAAARENTLAFNNHNIWLDNMEGRWQGRWTLNINLQQVYWPVEKTNLAVVNESLLKFVENLAQAGRRTAKELYGARGWAAGHGTDVWFNTAPTDGNPQHATFPASGAWLMQQLYDHYEYSPDREYLNRIYPLLKGSAEFFLDFMVTDPVTGWLVTNPSTSPENRFITPDGKTASVSMGSSVDTQIIRDLFRNSIEATRILGRDCDFGRQLSEALEKLPPHQIGKHGQIQEWLYDFKEEDPGHRHLSHLFAVYPDDDITLRKTPRLAKASEVVLNRRGDINRGWSGAWKINLNARLGNAEPAYNILRAMLTEVSIHPRPEDSSITPSFEGNQAIQGVTAGIAEMLMQSHSREISLLPALPRAWTNGQITGLRARGGYEVDIQWEEGILREAELRANYNETCKLRTGTPVNIMKDGKIISVHQLEENTYVFKVSAGDSFLIIPKFNSLSGRGNSNEKSE